MTKIVLTEITDENREELLHMALLMYVGQSCKYCEHVYEAVEDIREREVVFAGDSRIACGECFRRAITTRA